MLTKKQTIIEINKPDDDLVVVLRQPCGRLRVVVENSAAPSHEFVFHHTEETGTALPVTHTTRVTLIGPAARTWLAGSGSPKSRWAMLEAFYDLRDNEADSAAVAGYALQGSKYASSFDLIVQSESPTVKKAVGSESEVSEALPRPIGPQNRPVKEGEQPRIEGRPLSETALRRPRS